jgi:general stress protein 26
MLTTRFEGGLRARPLEPRPEREAGVIWFVNDLRSGKEQEIAVDHDVGVVFIDPADSAYLSLTARAQMQRDHALAAQIWVDRQCVGRAVPATRMCACCVCAR